jgi:hypothetical protein
VSNPDNDSAALAAQRTGTGGANRSGRRAVGWRRLTPAQATLLAALIGVVPAAITGVVAYQAASGPSARSLQGNLKSKLSPRTGFTAKIYPRLGLAFMSPDGWAVDDAAVSLGGGEIDIVKRYETTRAAIGVKFRVRSVQPNYVDHHDVEIQNELDPLLKIDPTASATEVIIGGRVPATFIQYKKPTGQLVGDVRYWWIRLDPRVKLEIYSFVYTTSPDRDEFWKEVNEILSSVVVMPQRAE